MRAHFNRYKNVFMMFTKKLLCPFERVKDDLQNASNDKFLNN